MIIEILFIFISSFIIGLSGALMPGPVLTVTISETSKKGFRSGLFIPLGHATLEFGIVFVLIMGLNEFIKMDIVTGSIGLLGGIFLLGMGCSILVNTYRKTSLPDQSVNSVKNQMSPFISGIVTSLSNPFWLLWWATLGSAYLILSMQYGFAGILAFYFGHILSDIAWYSFIAYATAYGRSALNEKIYRNILRICGIFLFALGIYFLHYGVTTLL